MSESTDKLENKIDSYNENLAMALGSLAYHIHKDIVKYVIEKNEKEKACFKEIFKGKIEVKDYLFEGSDCVFPGVKRNIGGKEKKEKYNSKEKAILDINSFPRHIWSFLVNGKCASGPNWKETGLNEFELAHIFAHKESETTDEEKYFKKIKNIQLYSQFTSAANVILLPKGTVRPTDNSTKMKLIFYKRHIELYEDIPLSIRKGFKEDLVPKWYSNIKWNKPFRPNDWRIKIDKLLEYRKERIKKILGIT